MKRKFTCLDKYEAQKLASLVFIQDSKETYITGILDTIENEVVVSLKDKSAHSILLSDEKEVELFADFIQSIIEMEHQITGTMTSEDQVEIEKQ